MPLKWYQGKVAARPILTQALTSAVLFGAGDVLAQQVVDKKGVKNHDLLRTGRMALYGGAVFGPAATKWYQFLQKRINLSTQNKTIAARVAADQAVFSTVNMALFLSSMAIMEGNDPKEKLQKNYISGLKANYMVWPLVQAVNFKFVPLDLRVLVVNFFAQLKTCLPESRVKLTSKSLFTLGAFLKFLSNHYLLSNLVKAGSQTSLPLLFLHKGLGSESVSSSTSSYQGVTRTFLGFRLTVSYVILPTAIMAEVAPTPVNGSLASPETNNENASGLASTNGENVTVFHDAENFNVKHPLMHTWTLWFTKPPSGKGDNWNDLLKEVVTFDSVEEFWGVYNNITACSDLGLKSDYHLFKKGVRPEWEDSQNKHGGKWSYQFKDKRAVNIDELWLHAQLAAIGETLEDEDDNEVMGVVVNVRKGFYRIGLWTRTVGKSKGDNASGKDVLLKIGTNFKEVLKLGPNDLMEFSGHTDSAHAGSTRAKAKYTV